MKLCLPAGLALAGLSWITLPPAHAQLSKPDFDNELLQITPERLSAFEVAVNSVKKPVASTSRAGQIDPAEFQTRLSKAKTQEEIQQIVAEMQAQAQAGARQYAGGPQAPAAPPNIREAYENAREALGEWHSCVAKAGSAEALKIGEATPQSDPRWARYREVRKRELAACGERPTFPESPVPAEWKNSGRSFYITLDRVSTYCREMIDNPERQLEQGSEGAVGWDSGMPDESGNREYHAYLKTEVDAMKPRCPQLVEAIDNAMSR